VTLQIVCRVVENEALIELHGWLSGPEIAEFQTVCASQALPFRVDLQNLAGASGDGVLALREVRARGAQLTGVSPYIGLLLRVQPGEAGKTEGR
jgi:hypothetical protein